MKHKIDSLFRRAVFRRLPMLLVILLLGLNVAPLAGQADDQYGTEIKAGELPVILGVRLNDPLANYPDMMKMGRSIDKSGDKAVYQRQGDTGKQLGDLEVLWVRYRVREERIRDILVGINETDVSAARGWLSGIYGPPVDDKGGARPAVWMQNGFTAGLISDSKGNTILFTWDPETAKSYIAPQAGETRPDTTGDPEVGPPVVMGVRLGDRVDKYKALQRIPEPGEPLTQGMGVYRLSGSGGYTHEGVPIRDLSFITYKGAILGIRFEIAGNAAERLQRAFSGKYFLPGRWGSDGWVWDAYEIQARMAPVSDKNQLAVVFTWKPAVNQIAKDRHGDKPVTVNKVVMGEKVKDYAFLERYKSELHGTERYRMKGANPPMFGVNIISGGYTVFDGRVSLAVFSFERQDLPAVIKGLNAQYGRPDESDVRYYFINLGDVEVEAYEENGLGMLFYTHTPTKWSADRAVDRYYAMHGQ